ncbi:MAG: outer membrane lipoprotein-sorting protein [Paracoccaceae bacterium]
MLDSSRFSRTIIHLRWLWIAISLALVIAMGSGLGKLSFDSDARIFFAENNPDRIALDQFEAAFAKDDNIGLLLVPYNGRVFTPETLQAVADLTERAWLLPYVRRVDSITNFQYSYADGDDLTVRDLVENPTSLTQAKADKIRDIALGEVALLHAIIPPATDVTAVQVMFHLPSDDVQTATPAIVAEVEELRAKFLVDYPEFEVKLTGSVMMNQQFAVSGQQDGQTLTPLMLLAFIVTIGLAFRTITGAGLALLVIAISSIVALGALGHAGGRLNSMSSLAPLIIMTLALASVGHILAAVQKNMRRSANRKVWAYLALKQNMVAITIASLTTVFGFLSLNFSISPPFRQLGNVVAVGVMASLFFTLFLLPSLLSLIPMKRKVRVVAAERVVSALSQFVVKNAHATLAVSVALVCVLGAGIPKLVLEDDFVRYFDDRYELRRDMDFFEDRLGGHNALEYALPAPGTNGINDPAYLSDVANFVDWLRIQPEVTFVRSVTDTVARLNMNMHGDDTAFNVIPKNTDEASQYLFLYELSLPYGVDLTDQVNVDRSALRVTVTMAHVTTSETRALTSRARNWFATNAPDLQVEPTGLTHVFAQISHRDVRSMLLGTTVALISISMLLLVVFRDVKLGLISLIPNLIPAIMAFGAWGYAVGTVTLAIAVVIAMTLGIVVDDTVHFLSKYKAARDKGLPVEQAISEAFSKVGTALFVTSVGFILGFSILAQSGFAVNGDMAKLTALTIGFALVADFFLLPSLLLTLNQGFKPMSKKYVAATAAIALASLVGIFSTQVDAGTAEDKGLAIMKAADGADLGWRDYYAKGEMILKDASGRTSKRALESYNLERDSRAEGDWLVIVFSSPNDIRGTASLTHSKLSPKNDDQWLFLPSAKRVKRISSSNRAGKFVSSEFSFEDLSSQEVANYTYSFVGQEKCPGGGGATCNVVDSFPVNKRSGYSKRTLWIDTKAHRQFQVKYYNRRGTLEKVMNSTKFKKYGGKHWRPSKITMKNMQTKKSTTLSFPKYDFRAGLQTADFSSQRFFKLTN